MIKKPKEIEPLTIKWPRRVSFYINALTIGVIVQFIFILYILGVLL